jgi:hypothetical protein
MKRLTRKILVLILLGGVSLGCHGSNTPEPVFEGCANDENWRTFDDYISTARIQNDTANNPKWLSPTDGWTAPPNEPPPVFQWQPSATVAGTANGNVSCGKFQAQSISRSLRPLHEAPISGTLYDIHFTVAGGGTYRIMTTRQSTTVSPDQWLTWKGQHLQVTLYEARLLNNEVAQGPFQAKTLEIFLTP